MRLKARFGVSFAASALLVLALVSIGTAVAARDAIEPVTFTKHVAPILYKNCTTCHRPGEIAPMSLLTYKDVRPWAKSIKQQVAGQQMPPWHADPKYGTFVNERRLSQQEIETIVKWVDQGAHQGDPNDLPPAPTYSNDWAIGTPDVVLSMQEDYSVPADGVVDYQHFEIPNNFTEDKWVAAAEIRPGNRAVVHHVILYVADPDGTRYPGIQLGTGTPAALPRPAQPAQNQPRQPSRGTLMIGLAPGAGPVIYGAEGAKLIKAGSRLTLELHYTPNGTPATDRTQVALKFLKQPAAQRIWSLPVSNARFVIPPGDAHYKVTSQVTFTEDAKIWSLFPHMHVRGKSFEYNLVYPDGRSEIVLSVPKYDFNWQGDFVFAEPLRAPKGSRLECTAYFDNSANNPANPDPSSAVRWGDQTWEEMMIGWTAYSVDTARATTTASGPGQ